MERLRGKIGLELVDRGKWHIDNEFGKHLCVISLKRQDRNIVLHDAPTHDFCEDYVDKMLEAEWRNDNFVFEKGVYGKNSKRPPQLLAKIERLQAILDKWRGAINRNLQRLEEFV